MRSGKAIAPALGAAVVCVTILASLRAGSGQTAGPSYQVDVDMVVLSFEVKDGKGRPVRGLSASDVRIFEDGIPQKISAFAEGNKVSAGSSGAHDMSAGVNVFVLFDTSNRMYKAFPYVYDSISELVRRLGSEDSVAIYTFSRNLFRAAPLTRDHDLARAGLNNAVAGDDTALFNALLLTLRDAAPVSGRRAIVAFSNGPDTASTVSPYDVAAVAENEGVPIHIISSHTPEQDQGLAEALRFLTERSGGNLYYARTRDQQSQAFRSAREDIESSYTACYYPAPNPNSGFRALRVEIQTPASKAYQVRTRSGYRIRDRERVSGKSLNPKK